MQTVYDFNGLQFNGEKKSLKDFSGKVLLIVNTASQCFFTKQFQSLERLYQKYKGSGFEILAFPSNDFREQEPMTGLQLETFCRVHEQVTFPVFKRIHVVGEYCDPLFRFLSDRSKNGQVGVKPYWNFHKYLIDKEGRVADFFYSFTSPQSSRVMTKIEQLIAAQ
ncbi:redoxin domain-containing protein [Sphingobacterium oryzagri]|uniref:Glutathione peroxidase n=1 Tax=Sphingobacterium oryzagri TaxID=3025669 RepID=A0ABY7WNI5_9SPHI|nr:redoxin domain-containing protein [Sphingobacterium sp. KACC 22765]WDF70748.1 redoxin domain-containing protein [Sphingobacterium sp. KACC 22765]